MSSKQVFQSPAIPEFNISSGTRSIEMIIKDPKYNSNPEVQAIALNADPSFVQYFKATRAQWFTAIKCRPSLWIVSPYVNDHEISTYVLDIEPEVILRLNNPTNEQCLTAIRSSASIVARLPKTTANMWVVAVQTRPDLLNSYEGEIPTQVVQAAVNADPSCVKYLTSMSESTALFAIKADIKLMPYVINKIPDGSLERIIALYPGAIQFIDTQTPAIQLIAIKNDPKTFKFCRPQTKSIVDQALALDPNNIQYVEVQTIEMARDVLARGVKPTMIFHSILEELALEKRAAQAKLDEAKRVEAEKAAQVKQDELVKTLTELMHKPGADFTDAQLQLLPQILRSNLDDDTKTKTIKLLLKSQ